jgi:hypothetical protein
MDIGREGDNMGGVVFAVPLQFLRFCGLCFFAFLYCFLEEKIALKGCFFQVCSPMDHRSFFIEKLFSISQKNSPCYILTIGHILTDLSR